jgi:hypothetical protein
MYSLKYDNALFPDQAAYKTHQLHKKQQIF